MSILKDSLLESFTDEAQGDYVTHNIRSFLDGMWELTEDMITGNVKKAHEDEVREHVSLMLVDRILFYSGFVLNDLQDNDELQAEFVGYIESLLGLFAPTADAEA